MHSLPHCLTQTGRIAIVSTMPSRFIFHSARAPLSIQHLTTTSSPLLHRQSEILFDMELLHGER